MIRLTKGRSRPRRWRAAFITCTALLVAALGGVNVTSASALGEQCSGASVTGLGAFLQSSAQTAWNANKETGFNSSSSSLACSGSQGSGGTPSVSFTPVSSAAALDAWGAEDGVLHEKEFGFPFRFLASDVAPAGPAGEIGTMLAKMKVALDSDVAVVPVTQTAIAIAAHPPALPAHPPCTVPRITANQLQRVFNGEIANWRQLAAASDSSPGGDCDQAITRIVRDESAGTTYQFKHYLDQVNPAPLTCSGKEKRTWAQLQYPLGGETAPNVEWPSNARCLSGEGHLTTVSGPGAEGESGPLRYVAESPGTITYGSLPEARSWAPKQIIKVSNGVKNSSPETGEGEANCGAAKYARPTGWESGVDVDWSQVYGSDPLIGETAKNAYPICTLTWDIAATERFSEAAATTVHDYLAFVTGTAGQAAASHLGYRALPASIVEAATAAISHINGSAEEEKEEGKEEEKEGGTGTVLCRTEPESIEGTLTCPKGQGFSGTVFGAAAPETVSTFKSSSGPEASITCTEGFFAGEFNEDGSGIFGGISGFYFGAEEPCTSSFPGEPTVSVGFENPPYYASRFSYVGASAPQGAFELSTGGKEAPRLRVQSNPVFGTLGCVYLPGALGFQVTNGSPTQMYMTGKWKLLEESPKEGICPTGLTSDAFLGLRGSEESSFYIAGQ